MVTKAIPVLVIVMPSLFLKSLRNVPFARVDSH